MVKVVSKNQNKQILLQSSEKPILIKNKIKTDFYYKKKKKTKKANLILLSLGEKSKKKMNFRLPI